VLVIANAVTVRALEWSELFFSKICCETMHALRRALPGLYAGDDGKYRIARQESLEFIEEQLFSSVAAYECMDKEVCLACKGRPGDERCLVC
jgi:hypothetical protein